jgi:hypothetical protein
VNAIAISFAAFVIMLCGAAAGAGLHRILPQNHLNDHSKDIVRLGSALIATISALVLGLLITSAKNTYDLQRNEVRQITARLVLTDSLLMRYGPEASTARELLRQSITPMISRIWGQRAVASATGAPFQPSLEGSLVYQAIEQLPEQNAVHRTLKLQALQTITSVTEQRILLFEQSDAGLPVPLLIVLIFWLTILLASFTLFSPLNPTSVVALLIIALSAAGAIFLILQMNTPFTGVMQVPSAPLHDALGVLSPSE